MSRFAVEEKMESYAASYNIGDLARLTGLTTGAIRFYESKGLIPPPARSPSGYRKYTNEALARVRMVLRAKQLGFSLGEIAELIEMFDQRRHRCHHLHCRLTTKLAELDDRISELHRLKGELEALTRACDDRTTIRTCPVLKLLAAEENIAALLVGNEE